VKHLALFDFDGTITKKDSLIQFIRFAVGDADFIKGMAILSPMLVAYKLKMIPNDKAKERMLAYFFEGMEEKQFQEIATHYAEEHIDEMVRVKAVDRLTWHKSQGHTVVVVSASVECWIKAWCDKYGIELIATRLESKEGKLTGKFLTRNCYGQEKVNRVKERYDLGMYEYIYAYGDSRGDRELLSLANEQYYKPFRE
jgi:HAD superfamily hydrolase (TIGR01490 family)